MFLAFASACKSLTDESAGLFISDRACTKTVAGKKWFDAFLCLLPERLKSLVSCSSSTFGVVFGDGFKTTGHDFCFDRASQFLFTVRDRERIFAFVTEC